MDPLRRSRSLPGRLHAAAEVAERKVVLQVGAVVVALGTVVGLELHGVHLHEGLAVELAAARQDSRICCARHSRVVDENLRVGTVGSCRTVRVVCLTGQL